MAIIKFDELQDLYNRAGGEVPDLIEYLQEIDMKERKDILGHLASIQFDFTTE